MNKLSLLILCLFFYTAAIAQKQETKLLNEVSLSQLKQEPYTTWYTKNHEDYRPNVQIVEALKKTNHTKYTMKIFFGSWCGDSNADGTIKLLSKDNSLNMNGTGIVWDGYDKISDTGLTGTEHNGSNLLTAGNTYTYSYSRDQGVEIESLLAQGVVVLGIRATSVNGTGGIKAVDGQFVFVPYDNTPPTVTVDIVNASLNDGTNSSLVSFEFFVNFAILDD